MESNYLKKQDYEEPCCPLSRPTEKKMIPIGRVIEKLDEYLNKNDLSSAERHLSYWLSDAEYSNDSHGKLSVLNEQIGLYRKLGKKDECLKTVEETLFLVDSLELQNTVTAGTSFLNAATGYKAFGDSQRALPLYEKAKEIYEKLLPFGDRRLGGLYNNMALSLTDLGMFDAATDMYDKAITVMRGIKDGETDIAVTYCNLADLTAARYGTVEGEELISEYLKAAERLLDSESLTRDGYYAFVCDKCAPTFAYYGYFLTEKKLKKRARDIYERN